MEKVQIFTVPIVAAMAVCLPGVLGIFGMAGSERTASAHAASQGGDLVAIARAFTDAVNRADGAKVRELTDPAFHELSSTGETSDLETFIKYTSELGVHVAITKIEQTGPNSVTSDVVATGAPLPPLPHPWTETGVLTFSNGKIISLVGTLSAQTAQDLQAFMQSEAQGGDLVATALAFADAYNGGDGTRMRQMADPAFQQVAGTGEALDLKGFIKTFSTGVHVTLSNCKLTGPDVVSVVSCDTILSGGTIPPLAHPWTETSVFTFSDGKVTRLDETLSAQTAQDLQAFVAANPAPGMPTTGSANLGATILLTMLGLLLVVAGTLAQRVSTKSR